MPESDIKTGEIQRKRCFIRDKIYQYKSHQKRKLFQWHIFSANNAHFVIVTESHNSESGINWKNSIKIEFKFIPGNM